MQEQSFSVEAVTRCNQEKGQGWQRVREMKHKRCVVSRRFPVWEGTAPVPGLDRVDGTRYKEREWIALTISISLIVSS